MSITFNSQSKTFYLDGKNVTYAFFINEYGYVEHLYFGKQIGCDDIRSMRMLTAKSFSSTIPSADADASINSYNQFPSELSFFGTGDYRDPAVSLTPSNGDGLVELLYDSHEILSEKPSIVGMPSMRG